MNTVLQLLDPTTATMPVWYVGLIATAAVSGAGATFFVIRDFIRGLKTPA